MVTSPREPDPTCCNFDYVDKTDYFSCWLLPFPMNYVRHSECFQSDSFDYKSSSRSKDYALNSNKKKKNFFNIAR